MTDSGALANITDVRELLDGRVLVNDRTRRRVLLIDSTLARSSTVFGDDFGAQAPYGSPSRLLKFGDSTVFVDVVAASLVVLGPTATIAHAMAPVRARDLQRTALTTYGTAGFDAEGREIYQGAATYPPGEAAPPKGDSANPLTTKHKRAGPIVRTNFDARSIDTLAWLNLPFDEIKDAGNVFTVFYNPLPITDDWTLLADGTVAIVRAHDYHIDWVNPDGKVMSTDKMPFDWRPLSPEDKDHIRDSVKALYDSLKAKQPPPPPGERLPVFAIVDATDMPDFVPPIRQGGVTSDLDGNVWIVPSTSSVRTDGLIYDIVNRKGQVFQRVKLPPGRTVAGFGRNGAIYLRHVLRPGDERLERVRLISTPP